MLLRVCKRRTTEEEIIHILEDYLEEGQERLDLILELVQRNEDYHKSLVG